MSTEVSVPKSAEVGTLYDRNTFDVDASDFQLPKVYICQPLTKAVQEEIARPGDVIVAVGPDDPDAEVVVESKNPGEGLLFQILRLDKGKSFSEQGGQLQTWRFDDPESHPDAWTTYSYTVALPEVDPDMPHKLLLTKSNQGTAKRINMLLGKTVQRGGNLYDVAFRLTTQSKQNDKGKWHVAVVKQVEATDDGITTAEALSDMVNTNAPAAAAITAPAEAPAI